MRLSAAEAEPDAVVVTVRNGGRPIPEAELPTLFEPFKKGQGNPAGLGLGLFIAREIVHAHQGSIDVTSSAEGTEFTVRLPRGSTPRDGSRDETEATFEGDVRSSTPSLSAV